MLKPESLVHLLDRLNLGFLLARGAVYVDGRRAAGDQNLGSHQIVRLHTRPKRYPAADRGLRDRVVFENADIVVIDKPSGLPTHATLDNALENAAHVLKSERNESIFVTHRLDIPTDGLLIFARTKAAQSLINREFARGRVDKEYVAVSAHPVETGSYRHFIDGRAHVPRPIQSEARPDWWDCRLDILARGALASGHWWHRVRPLTGKTHQIRAQFAALGAPLRGDELYGGDRHPEFGLTCQALLFNLGGQNFRLRRRFDITRGS